MPQRGRPFGPLKGETEQANDLARWLRRQASDWTVRGLEEKLGAGRSSWSKYLSGEKVIPGELLDRLVNELVDPPLWDKRRSQGHQLRRAAEESLDHPVRSVERRGSPGHVEDLRRRLIDAQDGQLKAERAERCATEMVHMLLTMLLWLQGEKARLVAERDQARVEARASALAEARSRLTEAERQLEVTQNELARARRERAVAEELKAAAENAASEYQRALDKLRVMASQPLDEPQERRTLEIRAASMPTLEDSAVVLEQVSEALNNQADDLALLGEDLGVDVGVRAQGDEHTVVPGIVVDKRDASLGPQEAAPAVSIASEDNADNTGAEAGQQDEVESEPYVRLTSLRTLNRVIADLNATRTLAGTLQAVVEGAVTGLGFDAAAINLVRPDGDLVVAAVWERVEEGEGHFGGLLGQVGSRDSWDQLLSMGEPWGSLLFIGHEYGWAMQGGMPVDLPSGPGPDNQSVDDRSWHPDDILLAPMYSQGRELLGVLSVDRPRNGRRPNAWVREALEMFSIQASIAIGNARLRAEMQRAMARLEREQQALRASEESFRQAFEYGPNGMAITELYGDHQSQLTRVNDALCRLLGRSRAALCKTSFAHLVHPDDRETMERMSADGGRTDVRLARRDGTYVQVRLRNSVVADASDGPRFLLTAVEER